jgi:hypothetical protein
VDTETCVAERVISRTGDTFWDEKYSHFIAAVDNRLRDPMRMDDGCSEKQGDPRHGQPLQKKVRSIVYVMERCGNCLLAFSRPRVAILSPLSLVVTEGSMFRLLCAVTKHLRPPKDFEWFVNGTSLNEAIVAAMIRGKMMRHFIGGNNW